MGKSITSLFVDDKEILKVRDYRS